jgi:hypothetical protein
VTRLGATAAILLVVLATGCSRLAAVPSAGTGGTPRLTRVEFAARAEAACAARARALAALTRPRTNAQRRVFFIRVAAIMRSETVSLAVLAPPRRDEREFKRLLLASGRLAAVSQRFVRALAPKKARERRHALAEADHASAAYDRAARRLGLDCRQSA